MSATLPHSTFVGPPWLRDVDHKLLCAVARRLGLVAVREEGKGRAPTPTRTQCLWYLARLDRRVVDAALTEVRMVRTWSDKQAAENHRRTRRNLRRGTR